MDFPEMPEGWARSGNLLYTGEHNGWYRGKQRWRNRLTVRVDGSNSSATESEADELTASIHAFLSAPTPASSVLLGEGAEMLPDAMLAELAAAVKYGPQLPLELAYDSDEDGVSAYLLPVGGTERHAEGDYCELAIFNDMNAAELVAKACNALPDLLAENARLRARPAPLSLLGSGDAENSIAIYGEWEMDLRQRIEAERMDWTEIAECVGEIPRLFKIIDALRSELGRSGGEIHDLKKSLSAAASTGGGAGQAERAKQIEALKWPIARACTGASDEKFAEASAALAELIALAAAPQHLVEEAAAGQWISVDERLPEEGRKVWVAVKERHHYRFGGAVVMRAYTKGKPGYQEQSFADNDAENIAVESVSHWMYATVPPTPTNGN